MDEVEAKEEFVQDNLPLVTYIMLHRIYDVLLLLAESTNSQKAIELAELHALGKFIGSPPAYTSDSIDDIEV